MTRQQIENSFTLYKKNWDQQRELDKALYQPQSKQQLIRALKTRAAKLNDICRANTDACTAFSSFVLHREEPLTAEEADAIFSGIMDLYYSDYDDFYSTIKIVDLLIPYYLEHTDYEKILRLLSCRYYQQHEILSRQFDEAQNEEALQTATTIFSFRAHFSELSDVSKRTIFRQYFNIIVSAYSAGRIDVNLSHKYLTELDTFVQNPDITPQLTEECWELYHQTQQNWLGVPFAICDANEEIQTYYANLSDALYHSKSHLPITEMSYHIYFAHLTTSIFRKEMNWAEGFSLLMEYYETLISYYSGYTYNGSNRLIDIPESYSQYLLSVMNLPELIVIWIKCHQIDESLYLSSIHKMLSDLDHVWNKLYAVYPATFLDEVFMNTLISLLSFEKNERIQEQWINHFIIKRHISTYIHITMVSRLAKLIGSNMLDDNPEIFNGLWGKDTAWITSHKDDVLSYIIKAARYHDIGKNRIGDIINTQIRPLYDGEYQSIIRHPEFGLQYANSVSFLSNYSDVILGHHKFYNGKGGYPDTFNNTASLVKPVIDLITICDCIDAATDKFGRNYKRSKKSDKVLQEIFEERGTRYNPSMAEYLMNHPNLKQQLSLETTLGRIDCCYSIYEQHIEQMNKK